MIVDFICQSNFGRSEGGRETWAYQFLPALLARRKDVLLRVYGQRRPEQPDTTEALRAAAAPHADRLRSHFLPATQGRWPLPIAMIRAFVAHKRRETQPAADVTIAAGSVIELLALLASRRARRTFRVLWLRGIWFNEKADRVPRPLHGLLRRLEIAVLRRAHLVLANGDDIAAHYGAYGIPVTVIKNAVDLARWEMPAPRLVEPVQVAFIGRLTPEKGILDFLAIARAMRDTPDRDRFVFRVMGFGREEEATRAAVERGDVVWTGPVAYDEMPAVLRDVDVCAAFTFAAAVGGGGGTSNAMLEQMAAGRVMLAWDNAIFRQWLDGNNAFLVPQGDVAAAVVALRAIADDRQVAMARAKAGSARVADFGVPRMMERFDAVLAPAMAARR